MYAWVYTTVGTATFVRPCSKKTQILRIPRLPHCSFLPPNKSHFQFRNKTDFE